MQIEGVVVDQMGFDFLKFRLIASTSEQAQVVQLGLRTAVVARGMCSGEMMEITMEDLLQEGCRQRERCFTNRSDAVAFVKLLDDGIQRINAQLNQAASTPTPNSNSSTTPMPNAASGASPWRG